ncbi:protein-tyrosine phosphatase-like protein, partial [Mycena leptocephala]
MSAASESATEIFDNQLYLSDIHTAKSPEVRSRLGITHVLSVTPPIVPTLTTLESNHLLIELPDREFENLLIHLPKTSKWIDDALEGGGKVLVHCNEGASRSVTVVCAYGEAFLFITA